jgi:hypothetical protein
LDYPGAGIRGCPLSLQRGDIFLVGGQTQQHLDLQQFHFGAPAQELVMQVVVRIAK